MSTVTPIIDSVEDLWPDEAPGRDAGPARAGLAPAGRQPGGVELRRRQHVGQGRRRPTTPAARSPTMWVKGSGSDLATMGPEHFTALRLDEVLPLMERDEMSDEDMVAYLARCQLDPAVPRARRSRRCCTRSSPRRTCTTRTRTGSTCSPAPPTASG